MPVTRSLVERGGARIEVLAQGSGPPVVMLPSLGRPAEDFDDLSLPEDERIRCMKHAFFAPGNDARVWLTGWHEDMMHAERAATEATPREEWWLAGRAPVLDVQPALDVMTPPESRNRKDVLNNYGSSFPRRREPR